MVMYISLMELVKAEVMVPRLMRKPPIITTGRLPKRLLSMMDKGAVGGGSHISRAAPNDYFILLIKLPIIFTIN